MQLSFNSITIPCQCPVHRSLNITSFSSNMDDLHLSLPHQTYTPFPLASAMLTTPSATRHSQMSAGSYIIETARLSAATTWHLEAERGWDTITSHSTLIAVYRLRWNSSERDAAEWCHEAAGCFEAFFRCYVRQSNTKSYIVLQLKKN